jgi:hypothetical protein
MKFEVKYTARPLKRGWYQIFKNWLPVEKNQAGVIYSHPVRQQRAYIMRTKNPKKALFSLRKQGPAYEELFRRS